ncbi:MAG: DUF3108 domain-containing protein [Desulfobacteraceae bacterium]|jgi:hypothetical protein|nr:DUF3108 domain-containing protein [Desulfobacteraceae bacterium]
MPVTVSRTAVLSRRAAGVALITAILTLCMPSMSPASDSFSIPFRTGERLTYQLRWTIVPAGEAVLEVGAVESVDGKPAYRFMLRARSNAFVDIFYKVRDRIDAWIDSSMQYSVGYRKKQREGSHKRNVHLAFDRKRRQVTYYNYGRAKEPITIPDGTLDPLSALYFVRTLSLQPGQEIRRPVTDGKKWVTGVLRVIRKEVVTVGERRFDTLLLEPDLKHVGGVFEKSPNARIRVWVTADHRKIPVRVTSRVVVGSFVAELVSMSGSDSGAENP